MIQRNNTASQPLISIVLPTYNGARYLRDAIGSCLSQTWKNLEVIAINDGSPDPRTREILDGVNDPRVRVFHLEKNLGLPGALNAGFEKVRGQLLTWTSDDNLYRPNALEAMARALREGDAEFVYARATVIDEDGKAVGTMAPKSPDQLAIDNCVGACFLFTREVFERTGRFDPDASLAEDYDYWVRVSKRFRMRPLEDDLYLYRFHAKSLSAVHERSLVDAMVEKVRRRHFTRGEILAADGMRAFHRGDLRAAGRLLGDALLRNPFAFRLYRPAAISILPGFLVRLLVAVKALLRKALSPIF